MNQKLKAKIIERYGSQWQFAHAAGLHEAQISRIVRGRPPGPSDKTKSRLARLLGCGPEIFEQAANHVK
jgi:plasmid maintenance system antidote protein VapI